MTIKDFYDQMAPFYHLLYQDWDKSIERQAVQLNSLIKERWGDEVRTILDVSCGIGSQALGLAQLNYQVTASDLSPGAVDRAKQEAKKRGVAVRFSVADMRQAYTHHQQQFDVVISCDNAVPHLLTDADILQAFHQFFACTRPGGGVIVNMRDYDKVERSGLRLEPERVRVEDGKRYILFQVWEFEGDIYEMSLYLVKDEGGTDCTAQVMRAHYYAIGMGKLMKLMEQAGYEQVKRLEGVLSRPVLIGTRGGSKE
jgi:SAM-dependent methyltransferase